jgi:ornithine--oxo-acid transaminase
VPVGVVLMRRDVFSKVFDRMDKAVVHGSTFAKNDLAMAAGLATLDVIEREKLIENAAAKGERLLGFLRGLAGKHEYVREARGLGLMLALELGEPRSLKLRAFWTMLETMSKGLTCQLVTIPLFKDHGILVQVAGHGSRAIKLLPTLTLTDEDCDWIERGFSDTLAAAGESAGPVWQLGKQLLEGARAAGGAS